MGPLPVSSELARDTVQGVEAPGQEMVALVPPFQNHSQFTHQFLTACPVPLQEAFLCPPDPPRWLFLTTPADSELPQLPLQAPEALGHGPDHHSPLHQQVGTHYASHAPAPTRAPLFLAVH